MPEDRTKPPIDEDLRPLPQTAIIAFAARCARRVQQLYKHFWPDAQVGDWSVIESAILHAQETASSPGRTSQHDLLAISFSAFNAGEEILEFVRTGGPFAGVTDPASAASAARCAARAAARAVRSAAIAHHDVSINPLDLKSSVRKFTDPAREAANAAWEAFDVARDALLAVRDPVEGHTSDVDVAGRSGLAARAAQDAAVAAEWRDLDLLRASTKRKDWQRENWQHKVGPSVPPKFFGPLWPDGEPEGWPSDPTEAPRSEQRLQISLSLPPMPDTPEIRAALKLRLMAVLESANAVHLAEGGSGLRIADARMFSRVMHPAGVNDE